MAPHPLRLPSRQTSANGQAANSAPCSILRVNETSAIRYSPFAAFHHSLFAIRRLLLAISEVTRHCPEMLPLAFHHSPFAIRRFDCSLLAARRKVSHAFRHPGLALTPFSPLPKLRERGGDGSPPLAAAQQANISEWSSCQQRPVFHPESE
jgi:hypothetical protein